jgi:DNA-binding NtrC family response regulator
MNILLADDEEIVHQTLAPFLRDLGHEVDSVHDGNSALEKIDKNDYDLALVDIRMPGADGLSILAKSVEISPEISVVIITGHGSMELAVQALRLGAADFLTKPVKLAELEVVLEKAGRIRELKKAQQHLRETITGIQTFGDQRERGSGMEMIAQSQAMKEVKKQIDMAAEAECDTVLITGETGVGKEVAARELHFMGGHEKPFIAVSCPAIPDNLVESELFGHMKGSFTGAVADKAGCFELADGGTLFLDEVADLSPAAQAKLLRVLETRAVRRVGGSKEIEVDVRVIAATNTSLEDLLKQKKLRQDLYYRLNRFTIYIPPLRERPEDIIPMAQHFLDNYAGARGLSIQGFSQAAEKALVDYDYPGNARELRNLVERAAMLCRKGLVMPEHLNIEVRSQTGDAAEAVPSKQESERDRILKALHESQWNRRKAAKKLGIPYSTLRYKINNYDINRS